MSSACWTRLQRSRGHLHSACSRDVRKVLLPHRQCLSVEKVHGRPCRFAAFWCNISFNSGHFLHVATILCYLTLLSCTSKHRTLSLELIPVYRQSARRWLSKSSPGDKLSLLSTRPVVTFPAKEHHHPSTITNHMIGDRGTSTTCPRLLCNSAPAENQTHDLMIESPTIYHQATAQPYCFIYELNRVD